MLPDLVRFFKTRWRQTKSKVYEETIEGVPAQFADESEKRVREVAFEICGMVELMYECWVRDQYGSTSQ